MCHRNINIGMIYGICIYFHQGADPTSSIQHLAMQLQVVASGLPAQVSVAPGQEGIVLHAIALARDRLHESRPGEDLAVEVDQTAGSPLGGGASASSSSSESGASLTACAAAEHSTLHTRHFSLRILPSKLFTVGGVGCLHSRMLKGGCLEQGARECDPPSALCQLSPRK